MIKIEICMGTHCTMLGNLNLYHDIEDLMNNYPGMIDLRAEKCQKICKEGRAPVIKINDRLICNARSEKIISKILEVIESNEGNIHSNYSI